MEFGIQFQPGVRLERALEGFPIDDKSQDLTLRAVHRRIIGLGDYYNPSSSEYRKQIIEAKEKISALGALTLKLSGVSTLEVNMARDMLQVKLRASREGMEPYNKILENISTIDIDARPFLDSVLRVRLAIQDLQSREEEIEEAKRALDELLTGPHAALVGRAELYSNRIDQYRIGPPPSPPSAAYYN